MLDIEEIEGEEETMLGGWQKAEEGTVTDQRLAARSIMGVPFGQHPLGFMVIRNMKQYTDRPEPLQLACFVAMMMLEQIRRTRMKKLT